MNKTNQLRQIERNYPVENIKIGEEAFWPFFRALIYTDIHRETIRVHRQSALHFFVKLRNAFLGIWSWTRQHTYLFFSNELERKRIDGNYYIDKLNEKAVELLGPDRCLYIELIERKHLKKAFYGAKKAVSHDFLLLFFALVKMLCRPIKNIKLEGEDVLVQILSDFKLNVDYKDKLDSFLAKQIVLKILLRYLQPKAIFISDYGSLYITYAAKSLGITVTEFQHGVTTHEYYHPDQTLNPKFCPDFFLAFGINDKEDLSHGMYVPKENIIPVGNYYLELIASKETSLPLQQLISAYSKSVCVPTNRMVHDYHVSFIRDVAAFLPEVIFIIVPREGTGVDVPDELPVNVVIESQLPFQEVVGHCHFNTCTYSTCSLESLSLGTQNILIDEDGLTSHYLGTMLTDDRYTRFVKSKEEYIKSLKEMEVRPKTEIQESNFRNYLPNYSNNIKLALKQILNDRNS